MNEKGVREWVKQKLDEGKDEQKIRAVVSKEGYDPSLVEEIKNSSLDTEADSEQEDNDHVILDRQKKQLRSISKGMRSGVKRNWKIGTGVLILTALLGIGVLYAPNLDLSNIEPSADTEEEPNIEGEEMQVVLTDRFAKPSRPQISEGSDIKFVNNASHSFNLTFDREIESFVIESGETELVDIDSVVYYTATPINSDAEEVSGSVSVQ